MPETSTPRQQSNPSTSSASTPKRSRPPGEMGGHTVMPWEQGEQVSGRAGSHIPAGSDASSPASGGSSKSVPPPDGGPGTDGLGQGAGASTLKAKGEMMPPASELEGQHPEGAEPSRTSPVVGRDDAPADAMAGAPPTAFKATPQASKDDPEGQVEGGDDTRSSGREDEDVARRGPAHETSGRAVTPTATGSLPKPEPHGVDQAARASAPKASPASLAAPRQERMAREEGSARSASSSAAAGSRAHPTNPATAGAGEHDAEEDQLIEALDKRLADMLARALHETVATAVRESRRAASRPPAPPPVQPQK